MNARSQNITICAAGFGLFLIAGAAAAQTSSSPSNESCPPWADSGDRHTNYGSPMAGCSDLLNLEHMVENKQDLRWGRKLGPADAEREALAIQNYEAGKVKDTKTEGSAAGSGAVFIPTAAPQGSQ
jgi:type IV pilus biogenesis protein CpaD/CtpE